MKFFNRYTNRKQREDHALVATQHAPFKTGSNSSTIQRLWISLLIIYEYRVYAEISKFAAICK